CLVICCSTQPSQKHSSNRLMKFLVDAQLPVRLARFLKTLGYDTIHTREFLCCRVSGRLGIWIFLVLFYILKVLTSYSMRSHL
ncbi:MAG: hypothetical protein ACYTXC_01495, partial [Nostoc sp.]